MAHHIIQIVALINDMLSEILFRFPFTHVALLEAFYAFIAESI
nr:hypothetical protein [Xylanibacter brevis]